MQTMQRKIITLAITLTTVFSVAGSIATISPSLAFATVVTPDFAVGFTNCPFEEQADRTIVTFDGIKLHTSTSLSTTLKDVDLVAGTYKVSLHSYDGYADRVVDPYNQIHEQWFVKFFNAENEVVAQSDAIGDLADGMEASVTEEVNNALVLSEPVTKVQGWHAFPEFGHSVGVVCAAFDLIPEEPEEDSVTIEATKIVCDTEADLPDWGTSPDANDEADDLIDENTAIDFVEASDGKCHFQPDWKFQWAAESASNPGDNEGEIGGAWSSFTSSTDENGLATVLVAAENLGSKIWVREVMEDGYLPFNGVLATTEPQESAEFYCHNDVLNYDNFDFISNPEADETYYCVGFNVLTEEIEEGCVNTCPTPDSLGDTDDEEIQNSDEKPLQDILNDEGYTLDVSDDQEEFQVWNVASDNTVNVTAKFLDEEAGLTSIFGYYINGDINTFVPIFRTGESVTYNTVTLGVEGTSYSIEANGATVIAFAIKVQGESEEIISTKNADNDGSVDQVIVYNPASNEYVLAFEDIIGGDQDFNDVVVRINTSCTEITGGGDNEPELSADIEADPETINEGESTTLSWTSVASNSCMVTIGETEVADGTNGNVIVSPVTTTTYTLTCTDESLATVTDTVTVTVIPTPVSTTACADDSDNDSDALIDSFDPGCHSDGNVSNESSYDANDNDETDVPDDNGGGNNDSTPSVGFFADPTDILNGGGSTLTWNTTGGDGTVTCDIDNSLGTELGEDGSLSVNPSTTTTYTIICTDEDGDTDTKSVTVTVSTGGIGGDSGNNNNNGGSSRRGGGRRHAPSGGQVLGAFTGPSSSCGIYISSYIKYGANNNEDDVIKLQSFLNEWISADLPITGFYGPLTKAAVEKFQLVYKTDILAPWIEVGLHTNINIPTGYVYRTTQRMINNLVCPSLNLPLPNLLDEISG